MSKNSKQGTRNCHQKSFRKVLTIYLENVDQKMNFLYDSDKIKIRLLFYRSLSTLWNIFGGFCTQNKWLKVICVVKSKVIQPKPKYKTRKFLKFNSLKIGSSETFTETRNKYESAIWSHYKHHNTAEFLVCVFLIHQQPWHSHMMSDKIWIFLMNVLLNVYICVLRKNNVLLLLLENAIKCTHLAL